MGGLSGVGPLLLLAVRINDLLISARGFVAAKINNLAESFHGQQRPAFLAIDVAQTLQKERAIIALASAVFIVRTRSARQQLLQDVHCLVVFALGFQNQSFVVG